MELWWYFQTVSSSCEINDVVRFRFEYYVGGFVQYSGISSVNPV